jgi:RNA polymerase sigma factor (TIGR02999 family)
MAEISRILDAIEAGEPTAAAQLMPLVYAELRRLAANQLQQEKPGLTLDATALVHEAYLRLVGDQKFNNRGHFFAAAAESMRRILIERARRVQRLRHGGGRKRVELRDEEQAISEDDDILSLDDALNKLAAVRPQAAELVQLRFFGGLTVDEAAPIIGVAPRTARRLWVFARAWLRREMEAASDP